MAPKLRVVVSSSSAYPPTHAITVNASTPTPLHTAHFDGEISVWVKDYAGDLVGGDGHEYFDVRKSMTYGIVVKGKFKEDVAADDVLFGNVFEQPIRDSLPWGTSVAVKFMHYVDPTLELDIYGDKPWALSPALACMGHLSLSDGKDGAKDKGKAAVVEEDSLDWLAKVSKAGQAPPTPPPSEKEHAAARRKYLASAPNRQDLVIPKDAEVGMEFCNGLLDFNTLSVTLPPPFHLSLSLLSYWDGQPVTYVCRRRSPSPVDPDGMYWSVGFEIVDEEARRKLEAKGGKISALGDEETQKKSGASVSKGGEEEASDDVD